jgi:glycerol-3-phosphate acyltransferase PlsX
MKIALDAMGGDFAPAATVEGAVLAARELGVEVVLVGDRDQIAVELDKHKTNGLPITVAHASEVVTMEDSPIESVLGKPESSLHVGYDLLKKGEVGAFVSAGNSGAMLTTGIVILGNLFGVDRPAIASWVPSADGVALLIDAGANTDVKAFNLVQFGLMGSVYWHHVARIARPRVGILSNGEEDSKGTEATRAAAALLRAMPKEVNYIGYVEGRDINLGKVDVAVTDGFTGNVALKTMEGFAKFMLGNLRSIFAGGLRGRLAYLLVRKQFALMRAKIDPSEFGGAPLLGVNGVAIISHGSANPTAIRNAIRAAANEQAIHRVNSDIIEVLAKIPVAGSTKPPESKGLKAMLARMRERLHRHPKDAEAPKKGEPDSPKLETEKEVTAESAAKNEVKPPVEIAPGPVSLNGGTAFAERLSKSAEPAERTAEETAVGADLAQKREEN